MCYEGRKLTYIGTVGNYLLFDSEEDPIKMEEFAAIVPCFYANPFQPELKSSRLEGPDKILQMKKEITNQLNLF